MLLILLSCRTDTESLRTDKPTSQTISVSFILISGTKSTAQFHFDPGMNEVVTARSLFDQGLKKEKENHM